MSNVFGPRPFSAHIPTVGYDYDFHRGIDFPDGVAGEPLYSPTTGAITRRVYSHFHWNTADHLDQFTQVDPLSGFSSLSVAGGDLVLQGSGVGVASFPAQASRLEAKSLVRFGGQDDWVLEVGFSASPSTTRGVTGIGLFNDDQSEYIALDYDGTTMTFRGVHSGGAFTDDGTTYSVAGATWLRVAYTLGTDTYRWEHSADGENWTTLGTQAAVTFTDPTGSPNLYWLSTGTGAAETVNIDELNWIDESQTVGRFGNWVTIEFGTGKVVMIHMERVECDLGDWVTVGQLLGAIGRTGFNARSGRVNGIHVHLEYSDNIEWNYDQAEALNPLDAGVLPRADVTNNIAAVVTNENDPDAVDSWRVKVNVTRADSDFDLDEVTFVGNLDSRTVGFNSRAGLNADRDVPLFDGVYIVPEDFDENSLDYECSFYFHRSVVGTTQVSVTVRDTQGNVVASL